MAWFAQQPRHRHRDESPKRYRSRIDSPPPKRVFRPQGPRRNRMLSWAFCIIVALAIAFWPRKSNVTLKKTPAPKWTARERRPTTSYGDEDVPRKKPRTKQLAEHIYRPDGLLDVNPKGRHPILELIERAERQWKRKVERQSKTLSQAVKEYKRRYGRAPPKGFEIWWDYADFHDVQLIDEYDSINARLEPFWGADPKYLQAARADWEGHGDAFTIGKVDGEDLALLNDTMGGARSGNQRAQDQLDILEDVQEYLPDFRATFTMHDGPAQFVSWALRHQAEEAAAAKKYIDVKHVADAVAPSVQAGGWAAACPPDSPIHKYTPPTKPQAHPPPPRKSFIYNHKLSMDPCLHPAHTTQHGYLAQYRKHTPHRTLVPTFSICASPLHADLLTTAPEQFEGALSNDPAWEDKPDERLLWRGRNTGILHQAGSAWNESHRVRLVETATRRGGTMRVLAPRSEEDGAPVGHGEELRTSLLNPAFMDVAFVGKPLQCRGAVCDVLQHMFEWRTHQTWKEAWQYKYIMDIDGNGWSARFKRLMTSKSLVFKCTIFPEWYTERIMPWVHYVPIQIDLSDMYDALMFFRGDPAGTGAHDDLARAIASAGKKWSETFYRREDMTAYHFRLILEYARVMSDDREAMSYREEEEEEEGQGA